MKKKVNS